MLVFTKLIENESDNKEKLHLICSKLEDIFATVFRQIVMTNFELDVHNKAKKTGELSSSDLDASWVKANSKMFGDSIKISEYYKCWWMYIPHFIHSPFYVYAYAFGDGLVNALYSVYEEGLPNFDLKYFEMLKAGGSKHHSELLKPFGLDASDPKFWNKGLSVISKMIDELEMMEES